MDLDDDEVDFRKLHKEFNQAVASDEKHQRENDAKFRAIHQKVASYDEFRDIVLASHLKPLDKDDKIGGMTYQGWNHMTSNQKGSFDADAPAVKKVPWTMPKTSAEFDKIWRRSCKNNEERLEFLLALGPQNLETVLKTECPLGPIILVLNSSQDSRKHLETVISILDVVSNTKRFSLALDFLEKEEKKELDDLLENCKVELENETAQYPDSLAEKFSSILKKYSA